ncbi:hypothetical protein HY947_00320 [Candidatus Gottesmanbacteria bacterium]|nr:hypothetical protein [Candidatus Gottesmanbacteria bacterium]
MIKENRNRSQLNVPLLALVVVLLGVSIAIAYSIMKPSSPQTASPASGSMTKIATGPTPTPTPTYLKPGKETYTVSQSSEVKGPKISSVSFDPHDLTVGTNQTITLSISSKSKIQSVSIEFKSDHKTRTLEATRISGGETDGLWQARWTTDDTVLYTYILSITSQDETAKSKLTIAPRS